MHRERAGCLWSLDICTIWAAWGVAQASADLGGWGKPARLSWAVRVEPGKTLHI